MPLARTKIIDARRDGDAAGAIGDDAAMDAHVVQVAMNGGMRSQTTNRHSTRRPPCRRGWRRAVRLWWSGDRHQHGSTTPVRPTMEPTERSMPPATITTVIPIAMMVITVV